MSATTLKGTARKWLRRLCIGVLIAFAVLVIIGSVAQHGIGPLILALTILAAAAGAMFL